MRAGQFLEVGMADTPEQAEELDGEEYVPTALHVQDSEIGIPDVDLLAEALERHGVCPLAYQARDGQLFVLIAAEAGFKWADIESLPARGRLKAIK